MVDRYDPMEAFGTEMILQSHGDYVLYSDFLDIEEDLVNQLNAAKDKIDKLDDALYRAFRELKGVM